MTVIYNSTHCVFASSDRLGLGAIYALREIGKYVPDGVAVVGFDNRPFAELVQPEVSFLLNRVEEHDMSNGIVSICGELLSGNRVELK